MTILVLFPGALGDFLCFYPTLEALRRRTPLVFLEIRLRLELGQLLCPEPRALVVRPLDSPEVRSLFVSNSRNDPSLRKFFDTFDEIYSWTGFKDATFRENLMAVAPGKAHLFAFRSETWRGRMRDYYLACVGGTRAERRGLRLPIRPEARAWATNYLHERGIRQAPLLALAPGSGAAKKNWPFANFVELAEWWHATTNGISLFITGPVERELWPDKAPAYPHAVAVADVSLDQLAALFERCCMMVGNDSGTTHLAAAVGIATFAIFGPTDPRQWQPWGAKVTVVTSGLLCAACDSVAMEFCPHRNSLKDIGPEQLVLLLKENWGQAHLDK